MIFFEKYVYNILYYYCYILRNIAGSSSIILLYVIYIYCNILCNIAGSSSRHQSSVYRVYLCPRFLRSTSRQIRTEVSVKQNHRQIPATTCKKQ